MRPRNTSKKTKKNRSLFYRISAWLHLWLGLVSGIVVVIISLTGALLTFEEEIRLVLEGAREKVVHEEGKALLPPSQLAQAAMEKYGWPSVYGVMYRGEGRSAMVPYYRDRSNYQQALVNPYTGEVLHNRKLNDDFFRFMLMGHYQLWLPRNIGKPIIAYSTLIFVIALITGLVLWWPKKWTRATKNASFKVKWPATPKRFNYDLHNVIGFYSLLIALVLSLTGMVYGMQWFRTSAYWLASGGETEVFERLQSDTTLMAPKGQVDEDVLISNLLASGIDTEENRFSIFYPRGNSGVWNLQINPSLINSFKRRSFFYEQGSLKLLKEDPKFSQANGGDQLMKLNYDLHLGIIGGIWTKIIAFLVCIISASLPITGFIIWWGKEQKKRKNKAKAKQKIRQETTLVHA
ncbi:PepSY-associated TM helix domain-containing protein [Echinicola vietnamensis]|uniref:Putative iron-regulated membrane protein n=1 Tax=Echinicola vietnamensis (strain DSM 17526 / LMG 23754 / KMM 6221) TaxID=926556 RepID=L0G5B6_ECHVK|nr:PepSY-associated TM helix domain-containing protein [Echinicola vietnamensis]AGA80742.1 putative iron-regulated membrane protein [Echinicola vietnamensis DSM 17526]